MKTKKFLGFMVVFVALMVLMAVPSWAGVKKFALGKVNIKSLRNVVVVELGAEEYKDWLDALTKSLDEKIIDKESPDIPEYYTNLEAILKATSTDASDNDASKDWATSADALITKLEGIKSRDTKTGGDDTASTTPTDTTPTTPASADQSGDQSGSTSQPGANDEVVNDLKETFSDDVVEDAVNSLEDAGIDINDVSSEDLTAYVENRAAITEEAIAESNNGKTTPPTVPAATNLLSILSDALTRLGELLSVTPKIVMPTRPTQTVVAAIAVIVTDGEEVLDINDSDAVTIEQPTNDVEAQAEIIEEFVNDLKDDLPNVKIDGAENGVLIATTLPKVTVKKPGYVPMSVNMRDVQPGRRLQSWKSRQALKNAATASVSVAADKDYFFLDENGKEVTEVTGDASKMTVVPYLEAGTYDDIFITVAASEKDQAALKSYAAATPEPETSSGSGGGCNSVRSEAGAPLAELGVRSVLLLLALFSLAFVKFSLKR